MLIQMHSVSDCRSGARFGLLWGVASSLGSMIGVVGGLPVAVSVGFSAAILALLVPAFVAPAFFGLSVAGVGVMAGAAVGAGQSLVLAWPQEARNRWVVRSLFGWGLGAGLGGAVALLYDFQIRSGRLSVAVESIPVASDSLMMVVMPPILGLVLGLTLWPAIPKPAPNLAVWLAAHVAAASAGWIAAWLIVGPSSSFFGLTWAGLVLGPLVYAAISGTMMLWVERRRQAVSSLP